ncbi:MAG: cell morphogenesis Las1 [Lasallia pustulata]|uniref:Cell morphogenesis Las1 n=1 Tax=Lasallia pustulata TaxID=136370 RepID=A0A5M8PGN1_9LECA|nr:MAG: cell morphogenesis Las1 [Lasallia pustulata]
MPQLICTPWRNNTELLRVRECLYPSKDSTESDLRRKACNLIYAWKIRGLLPHAVESTAFLTDAVLHDNVDINSTFAIRAVYSTAFCRFVTGLTDSYQEGRHKKSMYQVAKDIDLPASFVELRHQAIHEDLPSLVVLRRATARALEWLWDYYWQHQDEPNKSLVELNTSVLFGLDKTSELLEGQEENRGERPREDKADENEGIYKWEGLWLPKPIGCG